MYGQNGTYKVNEARYIMLKSKVPKRNQTIGKLRVFDPSALPPCLSELKQRRVNYINYMWSHAHLSHMEVWDPLRHGWMLNNSGMLVPQWYMGERVPTTLTYEEPGEDDDSEEEQSASEDSEADSSDEANII